MQLNFSNLMQFFAAISPILLAFCLVMISIFNSDIKGMVYLGGILIASLINLLILNSLKIKSDKIIPPYCNLIEFPFNLNEYISPAFNSMFIAFTLAYLYMPMQYVSGINYPVLIFITSLLVLDAGNHNSPKTNPTRLPNITPPKVVQPPDILVPASSTNKLVIKINTG